MATKVTFLGHSTTLIESGPLKILTDPVLRPHLGLLRRHTQPLDSAFWSSVDAVVISHAHHDHLDVPSLRQVDERVRLIVPRGLGRLVQGLGFRRVDEIAPGEELDVDGVAVAAVPAAHDGRRQPFGPDAPALGYVVNGPRRIYFAGDTDIFAEMAEMEAPDVALLPIWGWGPRLGPGHLSPETAARAAALLRARLAVPIHWGTLYPFGMRRLMDRPLREPGDAFRAAAAKHAQETEIRILAPGERLELPD